MENQVSVQNKKRLTELSALNVLLCFFVMFIHVSGEPVTMLRPESWQGITVTLCWRFCSFVVPGFLFLSGLKLFYNRKTPFAWKPYFVKRFRTVYEPYLFAVLLYNCLLAAIPYYSYPISVSKLLHYIFVGDLVSHFYFIVILVQFTLLLPLWLFMMRQGRRGLWIAVSFILTLLCSVVLPSIPAVRARMSFAYNDRIFSSYLIYWVLGCVCGAEYERAKAGFLKWRFAVIAGFAAAFVLDPVLYVLNRAGMFTLPTEFFEYFHFFYCVMAVLFFFLAAAWFGERMKDKTLPKVVLDIDRVSYPVYLWHCAFLYIIDTVMRMEWFPWQSISIRYAVRIAAVMIGTPVVCIAAHKIRLWADRVCRGKTMP